MTTRPITNDDLWSAIRGLGLFSKDPAEIGALVSLHSQSEDFAGQVITEAARQVLSTRRSVP